MNATAKQDGGQQWLVIGLLLALLAAAGFAVLQYYKSDNLEAALATTRDEATRTQQSLTALSGNIKTLSDKATALERKQKDAEKVTALLAKLKPQLDGILETTAANAKANKPEVRVAALVSSGLVGQVVLGVDAEAALSQHNRALALDPSNCVARLALSLGGVKAGELSPECAALLPSAAPASEAKPAATAPAAAPVAAAAPAAAEKAAVPSAPPAK